MNSAVEQIKERLPITEVLASYMTLIPAGRQYKAKCPFHNERTASFSISPDRGLYYCFGCGAKGDIFTFVQQFEGVDFNGALKILAERAGVELARVARKADDLDAVYELLEETTLRYQNRLKSEPDALLYLKGRGLTEETISQFRIGYAPAEWRFIADACESDAEKKIAARAGLIKEREEGREKKEEKNATGLSSSGFHLSSSGYYDRFRGRIMFPLADSSGRVVGFSGRIFPQTDDGPKYLNSPETEVFQKSRILFGFDKAKFYIKRLGFAILVEGQMDLVLSHQAGFRNTVATSGTAVSEQTIEDERSNLMTISRLTPHLFLAFDGDSAGLAALARAASVALRLGMNPRVVSVPEGMDPAEYIMKEGAEAWKARLAASTHYILHRAAAIASAKPSAHVLAKRLREEVLPLVLLVPSPVERTLYLESIASELGIDAKELASELAVLAARSPQSSAPESAAPVPPLPSLSAAQRLFAFLERFGDEETLPLSEKVRALSFEDERFAAAPLADDARAAALALLERDYAALDEAALREVARELAVAAEREFYRSVHATLSAKLRTEQDEALLEKLAELKLRFSA